MPQSGTIRQALGRNCFRQFPLDAQAFRIAGGGTGRWTQPAGHPVRKQLRTAAAQSALGGHHQPGTLTDSWALSDVSACCDATPRTPLVPTRPHQVKWGGSSDSRDTEGADHGLPPQGSPPIRGEPLRSGPRWGDGAEADGLLSPQWARREGGSPLGATALSPVGSGRARRA